MEKKYKLLKNIYHPFGNYKVRETNIVYDWLDEFGIDWLSFFEDKIQNNPEGFIKID